MAARKDKEFQELEVIFKSLAIRNNRFRTIFKDQDFGVSQANMRNAFNECFNKFHEVFFKTVIPDFHTIKVQSYGSMAEDLNYRQDFEDYGDFDAMILPTSENLMVHEEMIEYLPDHPLHVRIKGIDHPVLQSCLVKDTEYMATSALKTIHPAIYGVLGHLFPCMNQWMAQDRIFSLPYLPFLSFHLVKNSVTSPAITIAMAVSTAKASAFFERHVKESTVSHSQIERYIEGQPVMDVWKQFPNANDKEDEIIPGERRHKQFLERFFVDMQRTLRTVTAEEIVLNYDLVPALTSAGWPNVAQEWIKRKRKWPSPSTVNKVIQEGFHLVAKPPKNGGCPDCDFRISFSHAEFLLSQEMNDIQRECYFCLKQYHRAYLYSLSDGLTSFHLKNIYLQTIEETGAEMWREGNRAECMMKLLGNLLEALRKKDLRHFFVRSYNLFCTDYIEDPEILESMAGTVEQIMENPMKFSKDMLQNQHPEDPWPWQVKNEEIDETLANQRQHDMMLSANQSENNSLTCHTADELKELFSATMKELTDMASNDDDSLEALDPLERSLVEDFRDIRRIAPLDGLSETICRFLAGSHQLFILMALRPEPNVRRRVLSVIQGVVEQMKYMMRQVKSGVPGGMLGAVLRMFDPTAEDTFDWSYLMPPGSEHVPHSLFKVFTELLEKWLRASAQVQEFDMNDIPLD